MTSLEKPRILCAQPMTLVRCMLLPLACLWMGSAALAEEVKVYVNHAPASFYEILGSVDVGNKILLSNEQWFSPEEANVWVIFTESEDDFFTFPKIAQQVVEAAQSRPSTLARYTINLNGGRALEVQINDLPKTDNGAEFQGCVAALDVATIVYTSDLTSTAAATERCGKY